MADSEPASPPGAEPGSPRSPASRRGQTILVLGVLGVALPWVGALFLILVLVVLSMDLPWVTGSPWVGLSVVLGYASCVAPFVPLILGIIAWTWAGRELHRGQAGHIDESELRLIELGRNLGIIAVLQWLAMAVILSFVVFYLALSVFGD